jgi:hypothetical protein
MPVDRMPFPYLALGLLLGALAIGAWIAAFRYFRGRPAELSIKDKAIGFMVMGPFFFLLHPGLSARGYKLTHRETVGLVVISAVMLTIVVGSLIHAYAGI